MKTWICRCKHCGKEYSYQASGEGCNNKLNNEDYCPECMKAILDALEKIPVRFEHRWKKIERPSEEIVNRFKKLKKEKDEAYKKTESSGGFSFCPQKVQFFDDNIVSAAEFCDEWNRYSVESPSEDLFDENAIWHKVEEYDLIDKKFTGRRWCDKARETYDPITVRHWIKSDDVEVRPLSPICGNLLFMDILSPGEKKDESEEDATILDASSLIDEWKKKHLKNPLNLSADIFSHK